MVPNPPENVPRIWFKTPRPLGGNDGLGAREKKRDQAERKGDRERRPGRDTRPGRSQQGGRSRTEEPKPDGDCRGIGRWPPAAERPGARPPSRGATRRRGSRKNSRSGGRESRAARESATTGGRGIPLGEEAVIRERLPDPEIDVRKTVQPGAEGRLVIDRLLGNLMVWILEDVRHLFRNPPGTGEARWPSQRQNLSGGRLQESVDLLCKGRLPRAVLT